MWELAERADLRKKVKALARALEPNEEEAKRHIKQAERLTRIRNRLVHYKEAPTPVDSALLNKYHPSSNRKDNPERPQGSMGAMVEYLMSESPNPDIVHAVLSMPLEERRREIIDLGEWLAALKTA